MRATMAIAILVGAWCSGFGFTAAHAQEDEAALRASALAEDARAYTRELELDVQQAWAAAGEAARRAARERLVRGRIPPRREASAEGWAVLSDALRLLLGGPAGAEPGGWEQRLADAFSLSVVPGAFEARESGRGEPTTVTLIRRFPTLCADDLTVRLAWLGPSGQALTARTEPVAAAVFEAGRFEMYVRPPVCGPGSWRLRASFARGDVLVHGRAVRVDCVPDLAARVRDLDALLRQAVGGRERERRLDLYRLMRFGVRPPAFGAIETLRFAEGREGPFDARGVLLAPLRADGDLAGWSLVEAPSRATTQVLLVGGGRVRPEERLAGEAGRRWLTAARRGGFAVAASDLPLVAPAGATSALDLLARLAREAGAARTVLVAYGGTAMLLPSVLAEPHRHLPTDVVLARPAASEAVPDARLALPTLSIEWDAQEAGSFDLRGAGSTGPGAHIPWRRIADPDPAVLVELRVPERLADWIATR